MSEIKIIHRLVANIANSKDDTESSYLLWKTCLREIYFLDSLDESKIPILPSDQIFLGLEAETFLAEVLSGLKSPLVGETEVFGQFKQWWKTIPQGHPFKRKYQSRIEGLYALVKSVREQALCGQGSQSYGSLLRRHLISDESVDIIGAGHLVQEILPWIKNKSAYRLWCRNMPKIQKEIFSQAESVLSMDNISPLSKVVVIAAPLRHEDLNQWLCQRGFSSQHKLFDFRADSNNFVPRIQPKMHLQLQDFSSKFYMHQNEIEKRMQQALGLIRSWQQIQESKVVVRPFGWDDL